MKWEDTVAASCRYGESAGAIFAGSDVIYEHSEDDYQGFANVFAKLKDGRFCHYEWTYGSCSGCDEWESSDLSGEQVTEIMREAAVYFDTVREVKLYLNLSGKYKEAKVPTANDPTNGSIPGMLRSLTGEAGADFKAFGVAFLAWQKTRKRGL